MADHPNKPSGELSPFESAARNHEALWLGAILTLTALVYSFTLRFAFVFDDSWQIVQNQWVQSWRYVPGYFLGHVWPHLGNEPPKNYYRPLNFVWFRVVHAIFGLQPAGWHAATVLLHVFVTFLAYLVVRRVTGRVTVASLAALTFGIHPMRHETVGWISGTTESLWSAFFLLAFLAYLQSREDHRWRWMAVSYSFYAAALLSKEPAIVLPAIVALHIWLYGPNDAAEPRAERYRRLREPLLVASTYAPVALIYLLARWFVLRAFSHPKAAISTGQLLLTLPSVAFFYARQWLLPDRASAFYPLLVQTRFNTFYVFLPFVALVALATVLWLEREWLGRRETIFAVAWLVLLILPSFDIAVFPPTNLVHDRYFYLPSLGASLLLALALDKLARGPVVSGFPVRWLAAVLVLTMLLCYQTVDAVRYWANDYTLFDHAMLYSPDEPDLRNHLSITLALRGRQSYLQGDWAAAEDELLRAKSIDPTAADNDLQLGMVDLNTGRAQLASENFREAIRLRPSEPMFHFALGVALSQQKNCAEAHAQFAQVLALKPDFAGAQSQMDACQPRAQNEQTQASRTPRTHP